MRLTGNQIMTVTDLLKTSQESTIEVGASLADR